MSRQVAPSVEECIRRVFDSHPRIRSCALVDHTGTTVAGGMREGVISLNPLNEDERLTLQMLMIVLMNDSSNRFLGKADYVIIHRGRVMIIVFPVSVQRLICISTEPDYPVAQVEMLAQLIDVEFLEKV
ncbi:MAG: hypothetical protein HYY68_08105 [Thaumarchaeota archaeon]|nr:hypothetical protein [Nitrososphaerota archaeon]